MIIHHSSHIKESGPKQRTTHLKSSFSLSVGADQSSVAAAANQHLLQFKDVAELRTRAQTVQEAPVNFKSEVLQFDTVTLSNKQDMDRKTMCFNISYFICLLLVVKMFINLHKHKGILQLFSIKKNLSVLTGKFNVSL